MTTDATSVRGEQIAVPDYLADTYWWAYVHPHAVRVFERQWLVNLILWGNFARLRDMALDALGAQLDGRTLQVACVYGDLTRRLLGRLGPDAGLDVVDILPIQLRNLRSKLPADDRVKLIHGDSSRLAAPSGSYDRALLFFLLHEQPEDVRRATVSEALRVVRPGGSLVIVDYHRPRAINPLYLPMRAILGTLEPYALDLWRQPLEDWLPQDVSLAKLEKRTMFSGLYQMLEITV
ncbi:MAG: rhodoquinone biosynthesis methyltransferase RquA [Burkholderiales bacterium]|nr:MAG: rhodoquinone biosynthesis methyltransferase RquA [Burkholderiales bacterium]